MTIPARGGPPRLAISTAYSPSQSADQSSWYRITAFRSSTGSSPCGLLCPASSVSVQAPATSARLRISRTNHGRSTYHQQVVFLLVMRPVGATVGAAARTRTTRLRHCARPGQGRSVARRVAVIRATATVPRCARTAAERTARCHRGAAWRDAGA